MCVNAEGDTDYVQTVLFTDNEVMICTSCLVYLHVYMHICVYTHMYASLIDAI